MVCSVYVFCLYVSVPHKQVSFIEQYRKSDMGKEWGSLTEIFNRGSQGDRKKRENTENRVNTMMNLNNSLLPTSGSLNIVDLLFHEAE